MSTMTYTGTLVIMNCANCAIPFGIPRRMEQERRDDHETFWCPAGHSNYFPGESKAERAERRRKAAEARATHERDQREATERSLRTTKGHLTRVRKRAANGVCPFGCRRHFDDLQAHVETVHPDVKADA